MNNQNIVEKSFYDEIVENLKIEAKHLNERFTKTRNNGDFNSCISISRLLKDVLALISQYDWQLKYSKYIIKDDNGNDVKQISIWEQNHDHQIRNHKIWNIIGDGIPNNSDSI